MTHTFRGVPTVPGIALGQIVIYSTTPFTDVVEQTHPARSPSEEWRHFQRVRAQIDNEIHLICQNATPVIADIFSGQRAILHDPALVDPVQAAIQNRNSTAIEAVQTTIDQLVWQFRNLDDEYFACRVSDILDIGTRLLKRLDGQKEKPSVQLFGDSILLAEELIPSDLIHWLNQTQQTTVPRVEQKENVRSSSEVPMQEAASILGIGLTQGSPAAHLAILARSLELPMICGLPAEVLTLPAGLEVLLDGEKGLLWIEPADEDLVGENKRSSTGVPLCTNQHPSSGEGGQHRISDLLSTSETRMLDDNRIVLNASVNSLSEARRARSLGAEGIGLLRTEFLFHADAVAPTIDRHFDAYLEILSRWHETQGTCEEDEEAVALPGTLTIRAFDIGGDKPAAFAHHFHETNPALGIRGLRLLLKQPELLRSQVRAVIRMAITSKVPLRFMLPMVTTLAELDVVESVVEECWVQEGITQAQMKTHFALGVLIETPAAALMAAHFAPRIDFIGIGSNDLTQYTLAADRSNRNVLDLVDPLHPAVLQLMKQVCQAGAAAQLPVGLCGGSASDPTAVPLLLGLGISEFSVTPIHLSSVRAQIQRCSLAQCQALAAKALEAKSSLEVRELLTYEPHA